MNITLESLGLNKKELKALVVEKIVDAVMNPEDCESSFRNEIEKQYRESIKLEVTKLAELKVLPKVDEILSNVTFQETNRWGESEKPKLTMKEFLIQTAEKWMTEEVDFRGKTQKEDSYSWKKNCTRIAYMIHEHLQYHIENSVKSALKDINSKIAKGIEETVRIQIKNALDKLSCNVNF